MVRRTPNRVEHVHFTKPSALAPFQIARQHAPYLLHTSLSLAQLIDHHLSDPLGSRNTHRPPEKHYHSSLGYSTPIEFEELAIQQAAA
jgi:hypothetical protein